jgi:hypothetical protein
MDNNVPQPGQAPPAGQPIVVDPAHQVAPPPQPAQQIQYIPMQQYQAGGSPGSKFFDGITLTDIIVGTLTMAALTLAILYYRKKMKLTKVEYTELRSEVDLVKKELEDMKAPAAMRTEFG